MDERQKSFLHPGLAGAGVAAVAMALLLVPVLSVPHPGRESLPDFTIENVKARKEAFFSYLMPIAEHHNARIREDRAWLLEISDEESLGFFEKRRLRRLAREYRVDLDAMSREDALVLLLRRVDVVPESLVLVQAAKESAWGRSRFAREGNALFGEWCFEQGCGMVPKARPAGRRHEVEAFETVHDSVQSYLRNLNTNKSYRDFRVARRELRQQGNALTGAALAEHLDSYSERGEIYTQEVKRMIVQNDLEAY